MRVLVQPMLRIKPLPEPLPDPGGAQAVIVTSTHALRAIHAGMFPQPIPVFAVGRTTAAAARRCGFDDVRPADDARALAADIRAACRPEYGPIVYLAGRHRARDLARMLPDFQVRLAERYTAEPARTLLPAVRQAIRAGDVQAVTLYSGRAARAFAAACRREGVLPQARRIPALCLSRRIAALLQAQGWRAAWGAPLPQAPRLTTRLLGRRFNLTVPLSEAQAAPAAADVPQPIREEAMTDPSPATTETADETPRRSKSVAAHWVAIVAVAALAAIALIWLWSELRASNANRDAIAAKVAAVSTRIDDLAKVPAFADPIRFDKLVVDVAELAKRTSENSQGVAAIGERVNVRVSTVDARLDSQAEQLATLKEQTATVAEALASVTSQATASAEALQALTAKQAEEAAATGAAIAQLNSQVASLAERLDRIETWVETAQPARVAEQLVALAELRRMIDSGSPFASPLQRVRETLPAAADVDMTGGWAAHADTGIPTAAGLSQQLADIARGRPHASPVESGSSWVDSAVGTLLKGVRIGDGPALGADPVTDGLRAAQKALASGDLEAADAAVAPVAEQLPAVMEWREALTARREALATIAAWDKSVLAGISEASK